jgi:hypothetical protein
VLLDHGEGEDRAEEETSSIADEPENAGRSAMCHGEGMDEVNMQMIKHVVFADHPASDDAVERR